MATDGCRKFTATHVWVLTFVFVPCIHFGKAYRHHGLRSYSSAWCSCILHAIVYFKVYFSHVIICKFRLRIQLIIWRMQWNCLHMHEQYNYTRCSYLIFSSAWEWGYSQHSFMSYIYPCITTFQYPCKAKFNPGIASTKYNEGITSNSAVTCSLSELLLMCQLPCLL